MKPVGIAIAARLALFVFVLIVLPAGAQGVSRITGVELTRAPDHSRVVFESNGPLRFSLYALRNPERLVLDLEGVEPRGVLAAANAILDADHPHIKRIRFSRLGKQVVRMELDLKAEAQPHISFFKPDAHQGYRLVLHIYPPQTASAAIDGRSPAEALAGREVWLTMRINGQETAEPALLLQRNDGRLLASEEDLRRSRLRIPEVSSQTHEGQAYYALDSLRGLSYQVDEPNQMLIAEAAPGLFDATILRARGAAFVVPQPAPLGGFFNYDLFANRLKDETRTSGLFELGGFGPWGVGVTNFLARDRSEDGLSRSIRLDSTWTLDRPDHLASLRFGDAISGAGSWARPARFGGLQWARNFATQPGFVSFPLPGLSGEAVLPSTVDLYINDALRLRRDVPSGPFSIQDLPIVTGQGEARLVVRDALGRERVITQPYYASPRLLQQALHDFSYEIGAVRENFGIASNDYGRAMAVGTHRLGITDRLTGEAHGELFAHQRTFGLGAALLWPDVGVLHASGATSHSAAGSGRLTLLGFERQTRRFSFGANTQLASEHFTQLGLQPGELAPREITRAFFSVGTGYGSFGLSYTSQAFRDREDVRLLGASYSVGVGRLGFLGISVLRFIDSQSSSAASLTLTIPLDPRTNVSATSIAQGDNRQTVFQMQRSLPAGSGFGYRLLAGAGDSDQREAGVALQNDVGTYTLEAARAGGQTGLRAGASGGVALLGGKAFVSRRINDSFAVVEVPEYPNVRVYAENQLVARTNSEGLALVPRLRAYEKNAIRIEEADLPLEAQIDSVQEGAVPYFRSGVRLRFPVKRSHGALLKIVLENQEVVPAGAVVHIAGRGEAFPVGLRGELYVTGLAATNRLKVEWHGKRCELDIAFTPSNDPLPDLGTHVCRIMEQ